MHCPIIRPFAATVTLAWSLNGRQPFRTTLLVARQDGAMPNRLLAAQVDRGSRRLYYMRCRVHHLPMLSMHAKSLQYGQVDRGVWALSKTERSCMACSTLFFFALDGVEPARDAVYIQPISAVGWTRKFGLFQAWCVAVKNLAESGLRAAVLLRPRQGGGGSGGGSRKSFETGEVSQAAATQRGMPVSILYTRCSLAGIKGALGSTRGQDLIVDM
ncbi:hypothetical protein IAQ61_000077 [Plenodomus lingam]|uniref:uncharacterized protein n=1 Tax=Leptosphaeria maculans TaxID=5022 RepID=UPI00331CA565|nr:hypothetical protein IAQ61_000077 [Plenodomus lingam]